VSMKNRAPFPGRRFGGQKPGPPSPERGPPPSVPPGSAPTPVPTSRFGGLAGKIGAPLNVDPRAPPPVPPGPPHQSGVAGKTDPESIATHPTRPPRFPQWPPFAPLYPASGGPTPFRGNRREAPPDMPGKQPRVPQRSLLGAPRGSPNLHAPSPRVGVLSHGGVAPQTVRTISHFPPQTPYRPLLPQTTRVFIPPLLVFWPPSVKPTKTPP